jgi:Flp pilus assembly pilin Flp
MSNPQSEHEVDQEIDQELETPQTMSEQAQGLVEYGLIIALVAVLAIAGLIVFGPAVSSLLSKLGGSV